MEYLNIILPNNHTLTLEYNLVNSAYLFNQDIEFSGWTIHKIIKRGGPKESIYKHDFKNYLEFIITDANGISRIKRYFYNGGDEEVPAYWSDSIVEAIPHYIKKSMVFQCKDWTDYDACIILAEIEKIINNNSSRQEKLEQIKIKVNLINK